MAITKATASSIAPAAKGDLVVGSATNDAAVLGVGSNDQVLTADSSTATGLKWAAVAAGGKVLQVVNATYSTTTTIASTTKTDTGLSASITPTANTSKILVLVSQHIWVNNDTERIQGGGVYLVRGSTEIWNGSDQLSWHNFGSGFMQYGALWTLHYYDSPAATSSTTYKTQGDSWTTNYNSNIKFQQNSVPSSMTLLEIGA